MLVRRSWGVCVSQKIMGGGYVLVRRSWGVCVSQKIMGGGMC